MRKRDRALGFDEVARKLPAGLSRDGEPVFIDVDFLDGTKGAHVNISGVSGVATKTSYATFLLYGLFHSGVLGAEAVNTKALVFNVKGEDLLFLDHPNIALAPDQAERYRALGLPADEFASVGVWAPPRRDEVGVAAPDVASRSLGVRSFFWTIHDFCDQLLLPFLFADAEDDRQQYTMVVHNVAAELQRAARDHGDPVNGTVSFDGKVVRHFDELVQVIEARAHRRRRAGPVGRARHHHGHRQRVPATHARRHPSREAPRAGRRRPSRPTLGRVRPSGHGRRHPQPQRPRPTVRRRRVAAARRSRPRNAPARPDRCS